jgi:ComF family protein
MTPLSPFAALARLALPPRCPGCGAVVEADHRFCAACWGGLRFLGPPWCAGCAAPFAFDRGDGARCAACLAEPPRHAGVFAAVRYGEAASAVALRLKYGGRIALAETAGRLMARHVSADATLVVPVPLHRWRLWTRGYNQAVLLGEAVARRTGVPLALDILERRRATPSLRGLGARERARAVRAAFALRQGARVGGERVVLVDDVYTTGATAQACVRAILAGGAASVAVLAWARVLDDPAD